MFKYNEQPIENIIGNNYGYLTIVGEYSNDGNGRRVVAICKCGKTKNYRLGHIQQGRTLSCGCLQVELQSKKQTTHGLSKHPLYKIYRGIKARCYNIKIHNYPNYGGRGVRMCDEWFNDFKLFYDWCLSNGWRKGLHVDKDMKAMKVGKEGLIYSPEWCSIVTCTTNSRNTRTNVFITHKGECKTIAEWCEIYGISQKRYFARTKRDGWSIDDALLTPVKKYLYGDILPK